MNTPMMEAAHQAPQMMGNMMAHPMATGSMMAIGGYAAGKGLLGAGTSLLRNPLVIFATGLAAGYLLFRYRQEIVETATKLAGMGKDFVAHQKENLDDLIAETKSPETMPAAAPTPTQE